MRIISTLLVCALSVGVTWAQSQNISQIQGTVQDASGAPVPGAEVKATQTATGVTRTVTTGADGVYVLPNLPIGPYRLEVSKAGFSTYVQTGIVLQVATNPTVDMALKIGAVNEQVQVEANAALVETQATGVGNVMETQRILELPLNGRVATDLIQYTGAAWFRRASPATAVTPAPSSSSSPADRPSASRFGWMAACTTIRGTGEHAASFPRRAGRSLRSKPAR